jgi:hypothetical protein
MISDTATATLIAIHGAPSWRRAFWTGRVLHSQLRRFFHGADLRAPADVRAELLYTSATLQALAMSCALSLPW